MRTEKQKKVAAILMRKRLRFEPKSAEQIAAARAAWLAKLKPGHRMRDGTVFAGTSPDTKRPMFTTQSDERFFMAYEEAMEAAAKKEAHEHADWRVPSQSELSVLFNNKAAIGGFNETIASSFGLYWSSTPYISKDTSKGAYGQRFSDGEQSPYSQLAWLSVRFVCG